jgi:hypothetical protein
LKEKALNKQIMIISLLPLPNNQSLLSIEENGSNKKLCHTNTQEHPHASENKQEPMVKILGEFSEFISSKKLNNSSSQSLKTLGLCTKK